MHCTAHAAIYTFKCNALPCYVLCYAMLCCVQRFNFVDAAIDTVQTSTNMWEVTVEGKLVSY